MIKWSALSSNYFHKVNFYIKEVIDILMLGILFVVMEDLSRMSLTLKRKIMKNFKIILPVALLIGIAFKACEKEVSAQSNLPQSHNIENDGEKSHPDAIQTQELPQKIQEFLNAHYPAIGLTKYEFKSKLTGKEYEVKLDNGAEIEFDKNMEWEEIKDYHGVPAVLIPAKITSYVNHNYKNIKIKSIEKKATRNKMDVELLNDIELEFDMEGNFLRID